MQSVNNGKRRITLAIAVLWVILGGMGSPVTALDPYWEQKLVRGIEGWMVKPLTDLNRISGNAEDYNRFVARLKALPSWLEEPNDLELIREKMPAFERRLLADLHALNEEKTPALGIFNTSWQGYLVDEVNLKEAENLLGRIRRSLDDKQTERAERVCRACVKELKDLLSEAPLFTREFRSTFSYARDREAVYGGDRLVAGLIEHYKDFPAVRFESLSTDPRYTTRFAGYREIEGDGQPEPSYTFVLDPPRSPIHPAWSALGLSSRLPRLKFVAYYALGTAAGGGRQENDLSWALVAFETPEAAQKFWEDRSQFRREGTKEFAYLTLERVSWEGPKARHAAWAKVVGPYLLLIHAKGNAGQDGEEVDYLFGRLVRPE